MLFLDTNFADAHLLRPICLDFSLQQAVAQWKFEKIESYKALSSLLIRPLSSCGKVLANNVEGRSDFRLTAALP